MGRCDRGTEIGREMRWVGKMRGSDYIMGWINRLEGSGKILGAKYGKVIMDVKDFGFLVQFRITQNCIM